MEPFSARLVRRSFLNVFYVASFPYFSPNSLAHCKAAIPNDTKLKLSAMGRSSRHKERYGNNVELSQDDCLEGTSARTRPFSFDEIMLRRTYKEQISRQVKVDPGEVDTALAIKNTEKTSENPEWGKERHGDTIASVLQYSLNDSRKARSRKREMKEEKLVMDKDRETLKSKVIGKTEKHSHEKRKKDGLSSGDSENESGKLRSRDAVKKGRSAEKGKSEKARAREHNVNVEDRMVDYDGKNDYRLSNDSENEPAKKHGRGMAGPDIYSDRSRGKSEKESKRKHHNEDGDKPRDPDRKHHPERKYKDVARNPHEEPRPKRRKSQSGERDRDRGRRSPSHSPKTRKHTSKDNREQIDSLLHSSRDRSGRSGNRGHDKDRGKRSPSRSPKTHKHISKDTQESLHSSRDRLRRSRSRDRDRDRGKRSPAVSPKTHKHTPKETWERVEVSLHSSRERSGKSQPDVDRMRISSNGSNSHYRQHGGSSSGLGGYSPRKRKTDTAAKTPPPTHRSPERRTAGWDLPPVGKDSNNYSFSNPPSSDQILSSSKTEFASVTLVAPKVVKPDGIFFHASQMHVVESVQLTQATRPMRRLYVENLSASASEKELMECFNNFLLSSGVNHIQGTHPCISCIIHKEKAQALLEFLTPEDASAALSFDGKSFAGGSILKLRRPKDYSEGSTGVTDKAVGAIESISNAVKDSPHKIFIGGISKIISSEMLLEIAGAFGPLKAYHFEFIADLNERRAFLEYVDSSVTLKACAGLNGMSLGGRIITAVQATPDTLPLENVGKPPFYGIPEHAKPLLEKPTTVLKLKNVLGSEELLSLSEAEQEDILEDIRLECARFGTVKSINIVKPDKSFATEESEVLDAKPTTDGAELDTKSSTTEVLGGSITNELSDLKGSEAKSSPKDSENTVQTVESNKESEDNPRVSNLINNCRGPEDINKSAVVDNSCSDDKFAGNVTKDQVCEPLRNHQDAAVKDPLCQKLTSEQNYLTEKSESSVHIANSISVGPPKMENGSFVEDGLKLQEDSAKIGSGDIKLERDGVKELDAVVDLNNIFELGSVLVEYKRSEASCVAAHCLHGRQFDGRVVTVEYVAHDLYQMRFCR